MFSAIAILVLGASAATTAPTPQTGSKPAEAAHEPTITSEIFVTRATMSGLFEIEAGKLALSRSKNPAVKDFAQRMVTEHGAAGVELTQLVAKKTYAIPVAMLLDEDHKKKLKKLQDVQASGFDAAYGTSMKEDHAEAVRTFTLASTETLVDADLRAYATKLLPALHSHQELASKLPAVKQD